MHRKLLVVLVVGAILLAVPTAAWTGSTDDEAGVVSMTPHSGPNGEYASVDGQGEIEVAFEKLSAHSVTKAHDVFNITNEKEFTMTVWVEVDAATAYLGDDPDTPIDTAGDAVELAPGETIAVGFEIETDETAPATDSMTVHAENVSEHGGDDGSDDDTSDDDTSDDDSSDDDTSDDDTSDDGPADLKVDVTVRNGSASTERVIVVTVENVGSEAGTFTAEPTVDGTAIGSKRVTVVPGETRDLTFTYRFDGSETYRVAVGGTVVPVVGSESGAAFRVTDLTADEERVTAGNGTAVVATVANEGNQAGTYTAVLLDDGTVVGEKSVTVPAGETRAVTFRAAFEEAGDHELRVAGARTTVTVEAAMVLQVLGADVGNDQVTPGNATTISATVENTGDTAGEATLDLEIGGVVVDSVTVTVPAGETRTVSVQHRFETPGIYPVSFGGVSAGEVTVRAGDSTADRLLSSSLGVAAGLPVTLGLVLGFWRRRLFQAMLRRG
jgi:hypothetical protein